MGGGVEAIGCLQATPDAEPRKPKLLADGRRLESHRRLHRASVAGPFESSSARGRTQGTGRLQTAPDAGPRPLLGNRRDVERVERPEAAPVPHSQQLLSPDRSRTKGAVGPEG